MKIKKDNALAKLIAAAPPKALSELIMNLAAGSPEIRRECFDYLKENTAVSKMLKSQSEGEAILAISELRYLAESLEAMHDDWQTRNARNIYRQIGEHDKYLELRLRRMEVGADYYDLATFYWETGEKEKSIQIAQKGLKKAKGRMDELREFVADRAKESGDRDAWLALQFDQATDRITLDKYKKFKAMCTAEEWEQFEPGVLKKLKDAGSTEKLKIYMDRKEYEKVISLLEKDRYPIYDWDSHTIVKIASKLEKRYPEKILKWYLSGLGNLYDAKELFVDYAFRCSDKDKIADIILKVNQKDYYGIRDTLIDCAGECLPEDVIRTMIATLQKWAGKAKDEYGKRHHLRSIESLARQIKDAKLFEKTRIASWGKLSTAALIDIARVYLESGDVETAHSWLKKIPEGETYQAYERDKLLEEIYQKQGDSEKLTELLFQKFRSYQSTDTLQALLDVIGHDKRDDVISDETRQILKTERLRESDAEFLISIGKIDEAELYLLKRAEQLDGNHYGSLLSLAKALEAENRHLVTSLMYRSLLLSILERGYTKAYSHGIRYLKKLDKLATNVDDWKEFNHHEAFKEQVIEAHGRKRSFWSKYEVKK